MIRKTVFAPGEYYHLYSRGSDKRTIFIDGSDYNRFVRLLYLCNGENPLIFKGISARITFEFDHGESLADIGCYCLMTNHFHILIREKKDCGITRFMKKLLTAYSMYFNKKYQRTGILFESRFKSSHVDKDEYLKYLFCYIHLNPIKMIEPHWKEEGISNLSNARRLLEEYPFSSYSDYTEGVRQERKILNKEAFPAYFNTPKDFTTYLNDWIISKDGPWEEI
ncbi:MAG: transposase [Candidatus Taylorbacteria bacterium]|nr:transposase [Candidatus Taylorbacteria bacterium]